MTRQEPSAGIMRSCVRLLLDASRSDSKNARALFAFQAMDEFQPALTFGKLTPIEIFSIARAGVAERIRRGQHAHQVAGVLGNETKLLFAGAQSVVGADQAPVVGMKTHCQRGYIADDSGEATFSCLHLASPPYQKGELTRIGPKDEIRRPKPRTMWSRKSCLGRSARRTRLQWPRAWS